MRISTIIGVALVVAGAFLIFGGGSFASRREVLRVEGISVFTEEPNPIKPWIGGFALVAGLAVVFTAIRRKA